MDKQEWKIAQGVDHSEHACAEEETYLQTTHTPGGDVEDTPFTCIHYSRYPLMSIHINHTASYRRNLHRQTSAYHVLDC